MNKIKLIILNLVFFLVINNLSAFYGVAEKQGLRPTMEDAHCIKISSNYAYFGLFDGHGGRHMADYASENLYRNIIIDPKNNSIRAALEQAFQKTHDNSDNQLSKNTGCTALVALLIKDENIKFKDLYIANVGDSRAVLSNNGTAIPLSNDHKADRPDELERIEKLGGFVKIFGVPRVMGRLAMSRALGDKNLNPFVIPTPEIYKFKIENKFEFIILACDGIWDVLTNQEAVDIVKKALKEKKDYQLASNNLINKALEMGSTDNVSAIIINLS